MNVQYFNEYVTALGFYEHVCWSEASSPYIGQDK